MSFTQLEIDYIATQRIGRLATSQPDGTLQVNPVGFRYDAETGTIDVGGFNMAASRKYRNVVDNGRVAFVIDDVPSVDPWRVRCVEVRGRAEPIPSPTGDVNGAVIRIHPRQIISFGLEDEKIDVHLRKANNRKVG